MADTLHEAARIMKSEENPQRASEKTLAYLQEHAVRMRIIQSRLDDTIRTLNPSQRKILADYAVRKLAPVRAMVEE
jgi:DNA integrity scanning protein DisA with diadenylate cyclase activity